MTRFVPLCVLIVCLGAACGASGGGADDDDDDDARVVIDAPPGAIDAAIDATVDVPASPCGTCPGTSVCGAANGIPVCRAPSGIPRFDHVFVILMENTSLSSLQTSTTPFIHNLMSTTAQSSNYHGVAHPSLPNYIAMISGGTGAVGCDCDPTGGACNGLNCNVLIHTCGCPVDTQHLGDQFDAAGVTWRAYAESMGSPCNLTSAGEYATRHVPFVYFDTMQADMPRCMAHVVDYTMFDGAAATAPRFAFVAPNLVNDMHDPVPAGAQNYTNGDTWLAAEVPRITGSPMFTDHSVLIIVWDEDDLSGVIAPDDPIPMFVISELAKQNGFASVVHYDHYALLATIEDAFGLPRLGAAAAASPLADFFPAQ